MFNIGGGEFLVIGLIALIVLGPSRLPDAARQVGKVMGDLRRISSGFQNEIRTAFDDTERSPDPAPAAFPVVEPLGGPAGPATMDQMASAVAAVSSQADPEPVSAPAKKKPAAKNPPAKKAAAKKTAAKKAPAKAATKKVAAKKKAPAKKTAARKRA